MNLSSVQGRRRILPKSFHLVFLNSRYLVEGATLSIFILLGQTLESMYLAWEVISEFIPDLFVGA